VAFELVAEQGVILWHDYTDATYLAA
jgi:hypothetical protein